MAFFLIYKTNKKVIFVINFFMKNKASFLFVFLIFIFFFPLLYYFSDTSDILLNFLTNSDKQINYFLNENYFLSIFLVFIVLVLSIVLNIPGNSLKAIFIGFYYGAYIGSILIIFAITLGSFLFYLLNRKIVKSVNFPKTNYEIFLTQYFKNNYSWFYLIGLRIIPIIPLPIQNVLISTVDVSKYKFLMTTLLGISPLLIIYTLIGNQISSVMSIKVLNINDMITSNVILLFVLILVASFVALLMYTLEKKFLKSD